MHKGIATAGGFTDRKDAYSLEYSRWKLNSKMDNLILYNRITNLEMETAANMGWFGTLGTMLYR
jgi:hypothetical protein